MHFEDSLEYYRFKQAWDSVRIARSVPYTLFTFGESQLPYYLVCEAKPGQTLVSVRRGEVRIKRPLILTPENASPEFEELFDDETEEEAVRLILARKAMFSHMKFGNVMGSESLVSDNVEEVVARITRQLDQEDEDRVAILTAPAHLGKLAVLRYAVERVQQSAPENLKELSERGFLGREQG